MSGAREIRGEGGNGRTARPKSTVSDYARRHLRGPLPEGLDNAALDERPFEKTESRN